jgi:hypothetical protein
LAFYLLFLFLNHAYFFKIYYHSWLETIVRPNQEIFQKITRVASEEDLPEGKLPSHFHSLFSAQEIYQIYQQSLPRDSF